MREVRLVNSSDFCLSWSMNSSYNGSYQELDPLIPGKGENGNGGIWQGLGRGSGP